MKNIKVVYRDLPNGEADTIVGEFNTELEAYIAKLNFIKKELVLAVNINDDSYTVESIYNFLELRVEIRHLQSI